MRDVQLIENLSPSRWREYKNLRIKAITTYPQDFQTKLKEEESKTEKDWRRELGNKEFKILFLEDRRENRKRNNTIERKKKLVGYMKMFIDPEEDTGYLLSSFITKEGLPYYSYSSLVEEAVKNLCAEGVSFVCAFIRDLNSTQRNSLEKLYFEHTESVDTKNGERFHIMERETDNR